MQKIAVIAISLILTCIGQTHAEGKRDFIHFLIMDGKEDEVRRKITKYPSLLELPYTNDSKVLPLHHAAMYSSPELVKFLIEKGTRIDATCYNHFTALHLCKKPEVATVLIHAGADVTVIDSWGRTALQFAALSGRADVAKAMIKAGAKLDLLTATALNMPDEAAKMAKENPELLKSSKPHQFVLNQSETPLGIAASNGNLNLVKLYLELGADVNAFNFYPLGAGGYSPLTNAIFGNHEDVAEYLLQAGADPDVKIGKFGVDLLEAVKKKGNKKMIAMLEQAKNKKTGQPSSDQPATAPELKSESKKTPNPQTKARPR